jgi:hypothetical protein
MEGTMDETGHEEKQQLLTYVIRDMGRRVLGLLLVPREIDGHDLGVHLCLLLCGAK